MTNLYTTEQYLAVGGDYKFPHHSVVVDADCINSFFFCHTEWSSIAMNRVAVYGMRIQLPNFPLFTYYWIDNGTMELFYYDDRNDIMKPCVFVIDQGIADSIRIKYNLAVEVAKTKQFLNI